MDRGPHHKEDHTETPGIPMTAITCQRAWPEYLRNSHGSCNLHKEDCEDTRRIHMDSVTARTPYEFTWIVQPLHKEMHGYPKNVGESFNLHKKDPRSNNLIESMYPGFMAC